jgi:hypothetical protein
MLIARRLLGDGYGVTKSVHTVLPAEAVVILLLQLPGTLVGRPDAAWCAPELLYGAIVCNPGVATHVMQLPGSHKVQQQIDHGSFSSGPSATALIKHIMTEHICVSSHYHRSGSFDN